MEGPYAVVGLRAAGIFWRATRGAVLGLLFFGSADSIRRPATTRVVPEARTRRALPRENDAKPDQSGRE
jgi:hypothetical protein